MSKQITSTDQKENIHRRTQWISKYIEKQKERIQQLEQMILNISKN